MNFTLPVNAKTCLSNQNKINKKNIFLFIGQQRFESLNFAFALSLKQKLQIVSGFYPFYYILFIFLLKFAKTKWRWERRSRGMGRIDTFAFVMRKQSRQDRAMFDRAKC